jgi:hypothetical protein
MPIALIAQRDEDIAWRYTAAIYRNAADGDLSRKRAIGCRA